MTGTTTRTSAPRGLAVVALAALLSAPLATTAWAAGNDQGSTGAAAPAVAGAMTTGAMTIGEVRRVDAAGGKLTIRHGEILNLDMPPMTMVFRVRDAAMLQGLQQGDKIRFAADKDSGQYVVAQLQRE